MYRIILHNHRLNLPRFNGHQNLTTEEVSNGNKSQPKKDNIHIDFTVQSLTLNAIR